MPALLSRRCVILFQMKEYLADPSKFAAAATAAAPAAAAEEKKEEAKVRTSKAALTRKVLFTLRQCRLFVNFSRKGPRDTVDIDVPPSLNTDSS